MSIIPQEKGSRKSEESNFYSPVLLSKNLYPEIVRMERFKICWRYIHILKIASSGYASIISEYNFFVTFPYANHKFPKCICVMVIFNPSYKAPFLTAHSQKKRV
jgi:hypothetical protein